MYKQLIALFLVLALVGSASATSCWWMGTIDDDIYNQANYDRPLNPGEPDSTTMINWSISNLGTGLADGNNFRMFKVENDDLENQAMWSYCEWASSTLSYESRVEIINGSTTNYTVNAGLTIGTIGYGKTTWYMEDADCLGWTLVVVGRTIGVVNPDAKSCSLIMTGDSLLDVDYIRVGRDNQPGYVGIHDTSVLDIDVSSSDTGIYREVDETDGVIDLYDNGKIIWDGDHTDTGDGRVTELIGYGKLIGYGGEGVIEGQLIEGETIITAYRPGAARIPYPSNEVNDVETDITLMWTPGDYADRHTVYFGSALTDVNESATPVSVEQEPNSYGPLSLKLGQKYYWRVDEVNTTDPNTWEGGIWTFTVRAFVAIDDMESYDDSNLIIFTWWDGTIGNTSGSIVYLQEGPPVHSGNQSMKYIYKNDGLTGAPYYSEIYRNFIPARNWSEGGKYGGVVLFFKGDPSNNPEQMYVVLSDGTNTAVSLHPNANAAQLSGWQPWGINFSEFSDVNPEHIEQMYIGFGDRESHPNPGGTGTVYFDDIRRPLPVCADRPEYDLNEDCTVNLEDFALLVEDYFEMSELDQLVNQWLTDGFWP
ncbi:MAG: hypothetical protein JXB29_00175 [Sedimentisphaerales bacterium]|nr:hypothetical protein [Sedimentisphaerales bacterium]